jgi:hypothetical protein
MRARALHKKSFCTKNRKSAQKGVLLQFEPVPKNANSNEGEAIQALRLIFQVLPVIVGATLLGRRQVLPVNLKRARSLSVLEKQQL